MNETQLLTTNTYLTSIPLVTNILIAILILIIGIIIGRITAKLIERIFKDLKLDPTLKKTTGIKASIGNLLSVFIQASIYIIFSIIALNYVGITSILLNILFIAIIIILVISFILALKDSIPNILAGKTIRKYSKLKVGDKISIENIEGTIIELNLFEVKVETKDKDILHIPNSLFTRTKYAKKK
ncbi:MAG: mechanosensitive ion channel domain-containing protein [Candidatus Woesearchaeota archaeon]